MTRTGVLVMYPDRSASAARGGIGRGGTGDEASPPVRDILHEVRAHYARIGGRSPLAGITGAQAEGLADALRDRGHDDVVVALAMQNGPPSIEDVAAGLADLGVRRVIGLVLTPHETRSIAGACARRAAAALGDGVEFELVGSWATAPAYVALLADRVAAALESADAGDRRGGTASDRREPEVVFTAPSVPLRSVSGGDPYRAELRATAEAVAAAAGVERWSVAWQSPGAATVAWLGPDVRDVVRDIAADGGHTVIVCPAGFLADDLEVLYDLDVETAGLARDLGLTYLRTATPNDHPRLVEALADTVESHLGVRA